MSEGPSDVEDEFDDVPHTRPLSREKATMSRLDEKLRFCNTEIYQMPSNTFANVIGNGFDPKMVALKHKRKLSSKKAMRAFQTNNIISIHNGDKLLRVVVRESFPFMCGICAEAFHHTTLLQEHVERKHDYYQDSAYHSEPIKKPIIIEKDFSRIGEMTMPDMRQDMANVKQENQGEPIPHEVQSSAVTQEPHSQDEPTADVPMDVGLSEAPSDLELDVAESELVSEHLTPNGALVNTTEDGVEYILTQLASQGDVERTVEVDAGATEMGSSSAPTGFSLLSPLVPGRVGTAQTTSEKFQIIIPKQRRKQNKRGRKKTRKEKYTVVNAEHLIPLQEPEKKKRRYAKNGDEVKKDRRYCVVCHLFCESRFTYRRHAEEAHNIFSNRKNAELALEERRREQEDGMQDQNSGLQIAAEVQLLKCDFCETHVFDETTMIQHMRSHCGMPGFKCDICQEGVRLWDNNQLEEMKDLAERILSKERRPQDVDWTDGKTKSKGWPNSDIIHTCQECNEMFYDRYHCNNHCVRSHDKFTCKLCGFVASTMCKLTKHSKDTHKPGMYRCKHCPRGFHDQGKFNYHLKGHMGIFKCKRCGVSYLEKPALLKHIKSCGAYCMNDNQKQLLPVRGRGKRRGHPVRSEALTVLKACTMCNKSFVRESTYEKHLFKVHNVTLGEETENKRDTCKICGASVSKTNLLSHMKIHDKKHACNYPGCTKIFPQQFLLDQHLNSHERAPTYICEDCGKTFTWQGALRFHQRTHKERMGRCIFCSKEFKGRASLSRHMQEAHDHELSFSCGICEKQFANRQRLISHAQIHCERPITYLCDKCPTAFSEQRFLEEHHANFHAKLPYACAVCNKAFRRLALLKKHHRKEHIVQTDQGLYAVDSEEAMNGTATLEVTGYTAKQLINGATHVQIEVPGFPTTEGVVIVDYPHQTTDVAIAAIVNELQN